MIFKHHLPSAQEQPRRGSGGNLSICKNTWEGIFLFFKCALTEVMPASLLGSAVAVLGRLERLTGASPAAPGQGPLCRELCWGGQHPHPALKSRQVCAAKEIHRKTPCRWAGFVELWVMDVQLRSEKASSLRAWDGNILEVRKRSCSGIMQNKDGCYCYQHLWCLGVIYH